MDSLLTLMSGNFLFYMLFRLLSKFQPILIVLFTSFLALPALRVPFTLWQVRVFLHQQQNQIKHISGYFKQKQKRSKKSRHSKVATKSINDK